MTSQTNTDRTANNIELVQAGYDAFANGDLAAVERLFHPEVIWHAQRLGRCPATTRAGRRSCASSARRWR